MEQRKNIFQLVEENYRIEAETGKLWELFRTEKYFKDSSFEEYSFKELIEIFLFDDWKNRGTCLSIEEFMERANADIFANMFNKKYEDKTVNFVEAMLNFIKMYRDKSKQLYGECQITFYTTFTSDFCAITDTLVQKLGLAKREYEDRIIVYPKSTMLETILDSISDEDLQWDLIRYIRENPFLSEKKKMLATFATRLKIEQDSSENNETIKALLKDCTNILNNLQIRHPNDDPKSKAFLAKFTNEEQEQLCDLLFSKMQTILHLREEAKLYPVFDKFKNVQKASKE